MFLLVIQKTLFLFILISIGILLKRFHLISENTIKELSKIIIYVFSPALILHALLKEFSPALFKTAYILPLFGILTISLGFFLGSLLAALIKTEPQLKSTFIYLNTMNNYGFYALSLTYTFYGSRGVILLAIHNMGCTLLYWSLGLWILNKNQPQKKYVSLFNPSLIALIAGILLGLSPIKDTIPSLIIESLDALGKITIPLIMIIVGSLLAETKLLSKIKKKEIIWLCLNRLIIIPTIMLTLLTFLNLPLILKNIVLIVAVMPSASSTPILVKEFGGDITFSISGVFFTTLFSLLTVPIFLALFLKL